MPDSERRERLLEPDRPLRVGLCHIAGGKLRNNGRTAKSPTAVVRWRYRPKHDVQRCPMAGGSIASQQLKFTCRAPQRSSLAA